MPEPTPKPDYGALEDYLRVSDDGGKRWTAVLYNRALWLESQLDALRKPAEGPGRPRTVTKCLDEALTRPVKATTREILDYILALEAENRRLREAKP